MVLPKVLFTVELYQPPMKLETPRANWRTVVSEDEGTQVEAAPAAAVVVAAEVAVTPARRRLTMLRRIALGVIWSLKRRLIEVAYRVTR